MRNVQGKYNLASRWLWVSPIYDFTQQQCDDYITKNRLKTNPSYDTIGRSGDCYCGAYAHRYTELAELEEYYPDHYEWLMNLEKEAEQWDLNKKTQQWGWGGLSEQELRAQIAMNDEHQMMLCSNCDVGL
jgi:3'-phosphoadenosine 5'-phosphosulfate sulfotransferase (PAPS reductase)/FAD synthetase